MFREEANAVPQFVAIVGGDGSDGTLENFLSFILSGRVSFSGKGAKTAKRAESSPALISRMVGLNCYEGAAADRRNLIMRDELAFHNGAITR